MLVQKCWTNGDKTYTGSAGVCGIVGSWLLHNPLHEFNWIYMNRWVRSWCVRNCRNQREIREEISLPSSGHFGIFLDLRSEISLEILPLASIPVVWTFFEVPGFFDFNIGGHLIDSQCNLILCNKYRVVVSFLTDLYEMKLSYVAIMLKNRLTGFKSKSKKRWWESPLVGKEFDIRYLFGTIEWSLVSLQWVKPTMRFSKRFNIKLWSIEIQI